MIIAEKGGMQLDVLTPVTSIPALSPMVRKEDTDFGFGYFADRAG
jgi:hypothetical protein